MKRKEFIPSPPMDRSDNDMYMCLLRLIASGGNFNELEGYHNKVMERINTYKN